MDWTTYFEIDNLTKIGISVGILLLFLLLRKIFTKYVFSLILRLTKKTKAEFFTQLVLAFEKPIQLIFIVIGILVAANFFPGFNEDGELFKMLIRSAIIILITWGLYNLASASSSLFSKLNNKYHFDDEDLIVPLLSKVLRFLIVAIALTVILQEFGYEISGLIAGLGLGGLAISLAAQDALSNMFGGVVLITEKPFRNGDWIMTPSVEGTVEEITFRSTKVRTFSQAVVTVPNATLAKEPITNWSKMGKRQITFNLRITYDTPREKIETVVRQIEYLLKNHKGVDQETILVNFDQYKENGLDIFLYFFTKTTVWAEYLKIREEINLEILTLLEEEEVSIAIPSRKLYVEPEADETQKEERAREEG